MSLQFNDTTTYKGLVQLYERELSMDPGFISGDTTRLKAFTADVNIAFDRFLALAFESDGTWQFDDSNHTDYPIIRTALVDGQRDYTFTADENGNLVLDIYKVFVRYQNDGLYEEISPVDTNTEAWTEDFDTGQEVEGVPYRYDKLANGIRLDPIPSYNQSLGLKVYVNREPSYFVYTDTSKKPGVPGVLHDYFYLEPAHTYARRKSLAVADRLALEVFKAEQRIKEHFARRERDTRKVLRGRMREFR